jgi:mannose/fructose-specific phosphotransferase system component IIA
MSEPLIGVVLAHEQLAEALVAAVRAIAGDDHGLVPVSNTGCDRAAILARLDAAIAGRAAVVFADLPGGSCAFSAAAFARQRPEVQVVTGVNLAMLVDFVFHRSWGPAEAAARAVETGRGAVRPVGPQGAGAAR